MYSAPGYSKHYSSLDMDIFGLYYKYLLHIIQYCLIPTKTGAADSANAKVSCVNTGYYYDPLLLDFFQSNVKRPRLINRGIFYFSWSFLSLSFSVGYYVRIYTMLRSVASFCKHTPGPKQVVFLGAGFDSYFLMMEVYQFVLIILTQTQISYRKIFQT